MSWKDIDGKELNVGDEVLFVDSNVNGDTQSIVQDFSLGSTGVITEIRRGTQHSNRSTISIQFARNRDGRIFTFWLPPISLRSLGTLVSDDEETDVQNFIARVESKVNLIIIENKVCTLQLTEDAEASKVLGGIKSSYAARFAEARRIFVAREETLKQELAQACPLPNITLSDVARGMRVYKDNGLHWVMPFLYHPTHITENSRTWEIPEESRKEMWTELFCDIHVNNSGNGQISLRKSADFESFDHYHRMDGRDCAGIEITGCKTPAKAWETRSTYEATLAIINGDSIAHGHPAEFTPFTDLRNLSKEIKGTATERSKIIGGWSTQAVEGVDSTELQLGQLAQVTQVYEQFPEAGVGAIGTIVHLYHQGGQAATHYGIEFLFTAPSFHNCNGTGQNGHCYAVTIACVTSAPRGARRTRAIGGGQ